MNDHDALGYLASALVLATFSMRDMVALRVLAIASNLAFIVYAALAGIAPVLLLHALLLPMNLLRLGQALRLRPARSGPPRPPSAGSGGLTARVCRPTEPRPREVQDLHRRGERLPRREPIF
jgi:hypothetical protein